MAPIAERPRSRLAEISRVFFKLGTIGFGGPAAHIAMMEEEVVTRRRWLTREHFLDLLGITYLIPGPNSSELALHIGRVRGGRAGFFAAGFCFILPAVTITLALAFLYDRYGALPTVAPITLGIRSGILAVILAAVYRLVRPMMKSAPLLVITASVFLLSLLGGNEIVLLLAAGLAGMIWSQRRRWFGRLPIFFSLCSLNVLPLAAFTSVVGSGEEVTLWSLGLYFLKIGSVLYGGGYVLLAFLQDGLVGSRHWLTQEQLLDAIAIGQFTPGPFLSTATFVGYLILGVPGAIVATTAVFLPSFVFVSVSGQLFSKVRNSMSARGFLDGLNGGAVGLMLSVALTLSRTTLTSIWLWALFAASAGMLFLWKVSPAWIIAGCAVLALTAAAIT